MKRVRIIIIGVGLHAKRIYVPQLLDLANNYPVQIYGIVELDSKEKDLREYFIKQNISVDFIFTAPFKENHLPISLRQRLNEYVQLNRINGVIISTEATLHSAYANWALDMGLNILTDKPVTVRKDSISEMKNAKGIYSDFASLLSKYQGLQKSTNTMFGINVQRRYHPGFLKVFEAIRSMSDKSGCPITSTQSMHCDGEWRLPDEIVTEDYHNYRIGTGKLSHSGYHIIDCICNFYKLSTIHGKEADSVMLSSFFILPNGLLRQLNEKDYINYFGNNYSKTRVFSNKYLESKFKNYGEVDVTVTSSFCRKGVPISVSTITLVHNGFSRRTWFNPKPDRYKGNGRIKHEYHNIQQGPFQNIQIHSYQSKDDHSKNSLDDTMVGGNNHFDVLIFKNPKFANNESSLLKLTMDDFFKTSGMKIGLLASEQSKKKVLVEFISFILGKIKKVDLKSNIESHDLPTKIISGTYQSHIQLINKGNPLIKLSIP